MNYRKRFLVDGSSKIHLTDIDSAYTGKLESREEGDVEIQRHVARLDALQYLLYADATQSLLIVLQALDAGGKDGVVRHLFSGMNPQGTVVFGFKERQRKSSRTISSGVCIGERPARGRSRSSIAPTTRTCSLCACTSWCLVDLVETVRSHQRFRRDAFQGGTRILKFFLHISPEEQLRRFKERLDDPARNWKISESDYTEREFWPSYRDAYEEAMERTSIKHAPWYIIPADHKWFRNLAISQIIADTMDEMDLKVPAASVNLADIRRKYHNANAEPTAVLTSD